jgi:hypothetical protein
MLKTTNFLGVKKAGEVIEVESDVGKRWCKKGIAEPVAESKASVLTQDEPEAQEGNETHDPYEDKTAKELYDMCVDAGLAVEVKKSRKHYIEALSTQQA